MATYSGVIKCNSFGIPDVIVTCGSVTAKTGDFGRFTITASTASATISKSGFTATSVTLSTSSYNNITLTSNGLIGTIDSVKNTVYSATSAYNTVGTGINNRLSALASSTTRVYDYYDYASASSSKRPTIVDSSGSVTVGYSDKSTSHYQYKAIRLSALKKPVGDEPHVTMTYSATSTSSATKLCNYTSGMTAMNIDGVDYYASTGFTFSSTGAKNVTFYFSSSTLPNTDIVSTSRYCEDETRYGIDSFRSTGFLGQFENISALKRIYGTSSNINKLPDYFCTDCSNLTGISIPYIDSIGYGAFYYCGGLKTATITTYATLYKGYSFYGCSGITTLTFDVQNTDSERIEIQKEAFGNCQSLTSVNLYFVQLIGMYAFCNCQKLNTVRFAKTLNGIHGSAFQQTPYLRTIYFEGSCPSLTSSKYGFSNGISYTAWGGGTTTTYYDTSAGYQTRNSNVNTIYYYSNYNSSFNGGTTSGVYPLTINGMCRLYGSYYYIESNFNLRSISSSYYGLATGVNLLSLDESAY